MSESKPLPVVDYLKIPDGGDPYLEGYRCKKCGSTYLGERNVCSKCFARNEMEVIKLSETGILHSYAIVFRSFDVPVLLRDKEQLSFIQTELLKEFTIILRTHLSRSA